MKKILCILICGLLIVGMTGCGSSKKATIIDNEGKEVEMTSKELMDIYDSNEAKFFKLYGGAKITFESTVESIAVDTEVVVDDNSVSSGQNKIVFTDGWCLVIGSENEQFDLADYDEGDVLKVTTSIVGTPWNTDFLKQVSNNKRVVWLVGDDKINHDEPHSNIETTIIKIK